MVKPEAEATVRVCNLADFTQEPYPCSLSHTILPLYTNACSLVQSAASIR